MSTVIRIGEMHNRLNLEAPVRTSDDGGGATVSWSLVAELWGAIRALTGSERQDADGLRGRVTHEIWVRYQAGILPEMRFKLGSRIFEIRAVIESNERRRFIKCLAEERVP